MAQRGPRGQGARKPQTLGDDKAVRTDRDQVIRQVSALVLVAASCHAPRLDGQCAAGSARARRGSRFAATATASSSGLQLQLAVRQAWDMGYGIWVMGYGLWVMGDGMWEMERGDMRL